MLDDARGGAGAVADCATSEPPPPAARASGLAPEAPVAAFAVASPTTILSPGFELAFETISVNRPSEIPVRTSTGFGRLAVRAEM